MGREEAREGGLAAPRVNFKEERKGASVEEVTWHTHDWTDTIHRTISWPELNEDSYFDVKERRR